MLAPLALFLCALGAWLPAAAAPFVPTDDAEVVERLPGGSTAHRELKALRARLAAAPNDLALATALARRYIETGREEGDPRFLGYAQAALAPWWNAAQPPASVRVLRATIRQSQHQFGEALADLDAVLKTTPSHAQAWITRATILQVQARYEEATTSCERLAGLTTELVAATCLANVAGLTSGNAKSYQLLQASLRRQPDADPGIQSWAFTTLAEIALRQGDPRLAEQHFQQALALTPLDQYLLGAYADLLLDQNRPADVVRLLQKHQRPDGLLLRMTLAQNALKAPDTARNVDTLRARFAAAEMRGDSVHGREYARFLLRLAANPAAALRAARDNWRAQKEPADARILLEAAMAANDRDAAAEVRAWMERHDIADSALLALAGKQGKPS